MKLFPVLLAAILSVNAQAALKGAPFQPEIDSRFDVLENDSGTNAANISIARKYAKAVYDVSVSGGTSTNHSLNAALPAGAIITSILVYTNTPFVEGVGAGKASLAIQCAGTRDLMDNQAVSVFPLDSFIARQLGAGALSGSPGYGASQLIASGAAPLIQGIGSSISSACTVTAVPTSTIGTSSYVSGKATAIIEYFIK